SFVQKSASGARLSSTLNGKSSSAAVLDCRSEDWVVGSVMTNPHLSGCDWAPALGLPRLYAGRGLRASARARQARQATHPATLSRTSPRKPSTLAASIQRTTTTRSCSGSSQTRLLPAPRAAQLVGGALGKRARPVLSHQRRPYWGLSGHGRRISSVHDSASTSRPCQRPPRWTRSPNRAWSRLEIQRPPPQWEPPGTDGIRSPSSPT